MLHHQFASTPTSKLPWTDGKRLPKGRGCSGQANEIRRCSGRKITPVGSSYKTQCARTSESLFLPKGGKRVRQCTKMRLGVRNARRLSSSRCYAPGKTRLVWAGGNA